MIRSFPSCSGVAFSRAGLSAKVSVQNRSVGVHAAVAEERPVATGLLDQAPVAISNQNFRRLTSLSQLPSERVRHERVPEEFNAVRAFFLFVPHSIGSRDKNSIRDCMRSLRSLPGIELRLSEFLFLRRMPADRRRIKKN